MSPSRWARSPSHGKCSKRFCGSSRNCGRSHHQRQHETFDSHAFKSDRRNECVRTPRKTARSHRPLERFNRHRKAAGREAKLCYMGHATMENRHGLAVAGMVTLATGTTLRMVTLATGTTLLATGTAERRASETMLKAKVKKLGRRITVQSL